MIAVLNHNDVAYRFIDPKTIDIDTEFGVIIGVNKESLKAFVDQESEKAVKDPYPSSEKMLEKVYFKNF